MTTQRLAGAPRLIEWTGERCVPWAPDPPVIYEHFHRYLFASRLVAGRAVLDLASGEGFGSALLAQSANSVLGVDIEPQTVEHAQLNYAASNLEFRVADARELAGLPPGSFGAVVAFEMIEHVAEHDRVLDAIAHVLAPDGLLIMSTPERTLYSEASGFQNPYHVRELTRDELLELLGARFTSVATWAQRTITGSILARRQSAGLGGTTQSFFMERVDDDWRVAPGISPMYVIAVACNGELPPLPEDSVLADPSQELLRGAEAVRDAAREAQERAEQALAGAQEELARRRQELESMHTDVAHMRSQLLDTGDALAEERRFTAHLQDRAGGDARIIGELQDQLAAAQYAVRQVEGSIVWQLFQRWRRRVYSVLGGRNSRLGNLLQGCIRRFGRLLMRS